MEASAEQSFRSYLCSMLVKVGCRDTTPTPDNSALSSSSPSPSSQLATSPANEPTATSTPIDGARPAPFLANSTRDNQGGAPPTINRRPTFTPPSFASPHGTTLDSPSSLSDFHSPASTGSLVTTATQEDPTALPSSLTEPNSTSSSPTGIPTSMPPPNPTQAHLGKGAVVGIVVAICVAVVVLARTIFLCIRQRRGHRRRTASVTHLCSRSDGDGDVLGTVKCAPQQPHPCTAPSSRWSRQESGSSAVMPEKLLQEQSFTGHDLDLTSTERTALNGHMDSDATFYVSQSASSYSEDEAALQRATRCKTNGGVRLAGGRSQSGVYYDFDCASTSDASTLPPPYHATYTHSKQTR